MLMYSSWSIGLEATLTTFSLLESVMELLRIWISAKLILLLAGAIGDVISVFPGI